MTREKNRRKRRKREREFLHNGCFKSLFLGIIRNSLGFENEIVKTSDLTMLVEINAKLVSDTIKRFITPIQCLLHICKSCGLMTGRQGLEIQYA